MRPFFVLFFGLACTARMNMRCDWICESSLYSRWVTANRVIEGNTVSHRLWVSRRFSKLLFPNRRGTSLAAAIGKAVCLISHMYIYIHWHKHMYNVLLKRLVQTFSHFSSWYISTLYAQLIETRATNLPSFTYL